MYILHLIQLNRSCLVNFNLFARVSFPSIKNSKLIRYIMHVRILSVSARTKATAVYGLISRNREELLNIEESIYLIHSYSTGCILYVGFRFKIREQFCISAPVSHYLGRATIRSWQWNIYGRSIKYCAVKHSRTVASGAV